MIPRVTQCSRKNKKNRVAKIQKEWGEMGKVNSALAKLNLRCRVEVLRKLLDESLKF